MLHRKHTGAGEPEVGLSFVFLKVALEGCLFSMPHCSSKWQLILRGQIGEGERENGNLSVRFGVFGPGVRLGQKIV